MKPAMRGRVKACLVAAGAVTIMLLTAGGVCAGADAAGTVRVGGDVAAPERIHYVPPKYPEEAKKKRVEGRVVVDVEIGTDGNVAGAGVVKSNPRFDAAAVEAVKQWKFKPTILRGKPVKVVMTITVAFTLDGTR